MKYVKVTQGIILPDRATRQNSSLTWNYNLDNYYLVTFIQKNVIATSKLFWEIFWMIFLITTYLLNYILTVLWKLPVTYIQ